MKNQTRYVSFLSLLGILFIGLKLTGNIAWSWWWVLSPLWIPFAGAFLFVLVVLIIVVWFSINKK